MVAVGISPIPLNSLINNWYSITSILRSPVVTNFFGCKQEVALNGDDAVIGEI